MDKETTKKATKHNPPGFLIIKGENLERDLNACGKTVRDLADDLNIPMSEAYNLLSGEKAGVEIARRFINHYGAEYAHRYIDWENMGIADPYPKMKKRNVSKSYFNRQNKI